MNILHVVQAYYPFREKGGPVFKVRALVENLVRRGHTVSVLTADLGLAQHLHTASRLEPSPYGHLLKLDGANIFYLPAVARYRAMTLNRRLLAFCEEQLGAFDVIHFFGLYDLLGPTVSYFARRRKIPYFAEPMGMYRPIDRNLQMKRLWHRTFGNRFLKQASRLVATSELEQQELLQAGFPRETVVVRYNGIDSSLYTNQPQRGVFRAKWNLPADEQLILFLSRLIPRKGADLLIDGFAQACPHTGRLVIAGPEGEPGYRAYLEACASETGLRDRILFTGPVYGQEKATLYVDADLFVLPSRYENFANVAAEAMACGVPVILSENCGISSLVKEDNAGLLVALERKSLADAIQDMLSNSALRQEAKQGCGRLSARLSWEKLTAEMESCYTSAIANQSR